MIKSKNWWLITIKGLIFIFLGIYILKFPISGMLGLIVYGSVLLFISGLILAAFALITRRIHKGWRWQLADGILDIIVAIILFLNIGLTAVTFPYVFTLYGILTGIFWLFQSDYFRKNQYKFWWVVLLAGLVSILVGILIFLRPLIGIISIVSFIGILFIVHGFFLALFSFEISHAYKASINDSIRK